MSEIDAPDNKEINIGLLDVYARIDGGIDILLAIDRVACPVMNIRGMERMKEAAGSITAWANRFPADQSLGIKEALGVSMKASVTEFMRIKKNTGEIGHA